MSENINDKNNSAENNEELFENDDINNTDSKIDESYTDEYRENDESYDESLVNDTEADEYDEAVYDEEYTEDEYDSEYGEEEYNEDADDEYDENTDSSALNKLSYYIKLKIAHLKAMEPKRRKRVITLFSVSFLLVFLILTDYIPILPNAYNRFYVGNEYLIGETQSGVYNRLGKDVIYAGSGSIMIFGPNMECKLKHDSAVGEAMLETDGEYAVVYYHNSKEAYVVKKKDSVKNISLSEKVTAGCVNDKGYYGFVYDEVGYESCVNIFDKRDKSIYKWHTNNRIIDISVSNNGASLVAASYEADASVMNGKLIFFDTGKTEPVKEVVTKSNIFSEVEYINDDTVIAFGDTCTASYTSKGVLKWLIDYNGRNLKSYEVADDGSIAFVFDRYSSEMSESTVEIYSPAGKRRGKYESSENVKYVSYNNNRYLLSLDKKTVLLNNDADVMKVKKNQKEFRKAVLYHNYNFAFTVSDSVAEIMSVNH